jgi:hypothetical protein
MTEDIAGHEDVVGRLRLQFGALLPAAVIAEVVQQAEQDLRGQAGPGAMAELLHQLVTYRLTALIEAVRLPGGRAPGGERELRRRERAAVVGGAVAESPHA